MQAWNQSRNALTTTVQQMSAPELLALMLLVSFCCSILVVTSKRDSGSFTPVYEASSPASANTAPWDASGVVAATPLPGVAPFVGDRAKAQKRAAFAASVLPFVAASSAGGVLKGADTLWGPSERTGDASSTGNDDPSQAAAGAAVSQSTATQPDQPASDKITPSESNFRSRARSAKPVMAASSAAVPSTTMKEVRSFTTTSADASEVTKDPSSLAATGTQDARGALSPRTMSVPLNGANSTATGACPSFMWC